MHTLPARTPLYFRRPGAQGGFTLVELMITVAIISIIAAIAYPNYSKYIVRASRQAAQTEVLQLSNLQEKIFLNSNAYAASITTAYTGTSAGGLGVTAGTTSDGRYTLTISPTTPGQSYTITATPVAGQSQASDGALTFRSSGAKTWGSATSW